MVTVRLLQQYSIQEIAIQLHMIQNEDLQLLIKISSMKQLLIDQQM